MKKLVLLSIIAIMGCLSLNGQSYKIIGKGSNGQSACSGTIRIGSSFGGTGGTINVNVNDLGDISHKYSEKELIDDRTMRYSYKEKSLEYGAPLEQTYITVQKCNANPNNYFFHIKKYKNNNVTSDVIYLTTKINNY